MTISKVVVRPALFLALPILAVLLANAWRYYPFLSDDALISLRYTQRLLDGHGLTWTAGTPVEGYSNLLWVLVLAVPGFFGVDLIVAARALGVAGMAAVAITLAHFYSSRYPAAIAWLPIASGGFSIALAASIAVWAIGGLEQPLVAALLALSIHATWAVLESGEPRPAAITRLSVCLGLLCLTRPDGPLFAAAAAAALLVSRRSLGLSLRVLLWPVALTAAQFAFRVAYYGDIVPNTARVKIAPTVARWTFGWEYVSAGFASLAPVSYVAVVALAALAFSRPGRSRALTLAVPAALWTAYLVFIGGDIFPAYRHFVPLMVIAAFAVAEGARLLAELLSGRRLASTAAALAVVAMFISFGARQASDKHSIRAIRERWEWLGRDLAVTLRRAFDRQQPLIAVTAAGALPYWTAFPSLDMLGLNDHYLPRHPPPEMGTGFLGHELGDAAYVLSNQPDLIVFTVGSPPEFRVGQLLSATPEFHERYVPVTVHAGPSDYAAIVYMNKYSPKPGIGLTQSSSTVGIPGVLFTGEGAVARLNARDSLVPSLAAGRELRFAFSADRSLEGLEIDVVTSDPSAVESRVEQEGSTAVITLRSTASVPLDVEQVILRRR